MRLAREDVVGPGLVVVAITRTRCSAGEVVDVVLVHDERQLVLGGHFSAAIDDVKRSQDVILCVTHAQQLNHELLEWLVSDRTLFLRVSKLTMQQGGKCTLEPR